METGLNGDRHLVVGNIVVFYRNFWWSHVTIFEEEECDKKGNLSPRHTDSCDEVSDKESQASDRFHCTSITVDKKVLFLQWALHGLVIQVFLFHCATL
jgi:uncharacterized membrane protein YjfL (UPF0719 family)